MHIYYLAIILTTCSFITIGNSCFSTIIDLRNEQELHNLHVLAANIQDTLSTSRSTSNLSRLWRSLTAVNICIKFEVPAESLPPLLMQLAAFYALGIWKSGP